MKLEKKEKAWIGYDVGNSAFVLLCTTILPIYFNFIAEKNSISKVDYLAYWGYAATIVTLLSAFIGPVIGGISDEKRNKKKLFFNSVLIGVIFCAILAFPNNWILFLIIYIISKTGYMVSVVLYDSMLNDITLHERMDEVSSKGYAWGYIGSVIPFVISLLFLFTYKSINMSFKVAMAIVFILNALWWFLCTVPLLKVYKQKNIEKKSLENIKFNVVKTIKKIALDKKILFFLIAFFFYIDGVQTIISMAVAYGSSLGLDAKALLLALLVTQLVAFPFAIITAKMASKIGTSKVITLCIVGYVAIAFFAMGLDSEWEFWVLAFAVGIFQGGIQALSRSYYAKIIPDEKSGEYFGIYDICGKGASLLGTFMVGFITQLTGKQPLGISFLVVMFIIGFIFFRKAVNEKQIN